MKQPKFTACALATAVLLGLTACGGDGQEDQNAQSSFGNSVNAPAAEGPQAVNPEERPADPARPLVAETPELQGAAPPRQISQSELVGQVQSPRSNAENQGEPMMPELRELLPDDYTREDSGIKTLASAELMPSAGHQTTGRVVFIETEAEEGVRVIAKVTGIPGGSHGFHVHENGDCSAPDASSAGDHYNPTDAMHAGRDADARHLGDLGNLLANEDAIAAADFTDTKLSLTGANSIVGKAFILHAQADDLVTQPSGNSGDRIACGVIEQQDLAGVLEAD